MSYEARLPWRTALVVGVALLAGCEKKPVESLDEDASDSGSVEVSQPLKALTYCAEGNITILNPALNNTLTNLKVVHANVFDQLVEFDANVQVVPGLAERWEVSSDDKAVTFFLRKDVPFHPADNGFKPTRPLNADDVLDTFARYSDVSHPLHASPTSNKSNFTYWKFKKMDALIERLEKLDEHTVRFVLKRKEAELLPILATAAFSIFSKEYADYAVSHSQPDWFDNQPVGTGPFRVKSLANGELVLEAMPDHFNGRPQVGTVTIKPVLSGTDRSRGVSDGTCDIAADPLVAEYLAAKQSHPEHQYLTVKSKNINFLSINQNAVPDARAKRAISMALNRPAYVQEIFAGQARTVGSLVDQSLLSSSYEIPGTYTQQPDQARQLLVDSGFAGKTLTLLYMPVARPYNLDGKRLAEMMKADLEAVGLKIRLATVGLDANDASKKPVLIYDDTPAPAGVKPDFSVYGTFIQGGGHELAQYGDNPLMPSGKDRYLNAVRAGIAEPGKTGTNYSRWSNDAFELINDEINQTTDTTRLQQLYAQAEAILADEVPYATVLSGDLFRIASENVEGYALHPLHIEHFQNVRVK